MSKESLRATADRLVAHCRADTTEQGLDELYDRDAVSIEAGPQPDGSSAETRGVEGIRAKHQWWSSAMEVHALVADGPYLHGDDRFAVIFEFDATERKTGRRVQMKEVGVYTVNDAGKIVREEFFYTV
jgi:hypothetical protein